MAGNASYRAIQEKDGHTLKGSDELEIESSSSSDPMIPVSRSSNLNYSCGKTKDTGFNNKRCV
ncbi:MAG: hypothetical protein OEY19_10800 [Gammaproteobacteria bacterium]|nr:hypothetical protein [Gammaproteobacteria bacterium]